MITDIYHTSDDDCIGNLKDYHFLILKGFEAPL